MNTLAFSKTCRDCSLELTPDSAGWRHGWGEYLCDDCYDASLARELELLRGRVAAYDRLFAALADVLQAAASLPRAA